MPLKRLTTRFLKSVSANPPCMVVAYYDVKLTGFLCRAYPTGRISFFLIFKTKESVNKVYRKIGAFPALSPDQAREICKSYLLQVALEQNPLEKYRQKTKNDNDFCHYIDKFINEHVSTKKKETIIFYNKIIKLHILPNFKSRAVAEIKQSDILILKKKMDSIKTTYNRTHAVLSKFFNFCIMHEVIQNNPMKGIPKYKENKRTGRITKDEYASIIASKYTLLNTGKLTKVAASALLFLIFSGCRVSECLTCRWKYVDLTNDAINLPDSKAGPKKIYLTPHLKSILQSLPHKNAYVFPAKYGDHHIVNIYKPFKKVLEHAGLAGKYVIHELRHGYISTGINSNIPTAAVQAAVSHKSILTTQAYSHHSAKLAIDAAARIENIIAAGSGEIVDKIIQSVH